MKLTDDQLNHSMQLSFIMAMNCAEQLHNGVPIEVLIHVLAVNLGGLVCQKEQASTDGATGVVDKIIEHTIKLIQENDKSPFPLPSSN
jgi:hypothetical protein